MDSEIDVGQCYLAIKQTNSEISASRLGDLPMHRLTPAGRAFVFATYCAHQGKPDRAKSFLELAKEIGSETERAYILHVGACLAFLLGHFEEAIRFGKEAEQLARSLDDDGLRTDCLTNLAGTYSALGDDRIAKAYEEEAEKAKR